MASSKTITLISSDGETFDLEEVAARESQVIKGMIEDGCADNGIPLPKVTSKILAKVIEYCKKHVETPKAEEHAVNDELKGWAADFFKDDRATFFELIKAADYLRIESLLDLARQTVVDMTKEMSPAEICEIYVSIREKSLDNAILPNVTSKTLAMVIEYCKKHVETPEAEEHAVNDELKAWAADLFQVDQATLFDLINAAKYLDIKSLLDLTCQTVADMIKGKTPEEIRKTFNITNASTPEEEEEVRRENQWAFE